MKTQNSRWLALASLVLGLGLSTSAQAVWVFDTLPSGNTYNPTAPVVTGDPKVTLSGVYAANNASNVIGGNWSSYSLVSHGAAGLGMLSDGNTAPNHAFDNVGNTEAVLLSFGSSVVLSSIGLGYTNNGTTDGAQVDLSVFRWVGTGSPTQMPLVPLVGKDSVAHAGWELVGNYGDMVVDNTAEYNKINTGNAGGTGALAGGGGKGSSWWLISAYNTGFAQTTFAQAGTENRGSLDNGNDYFKLYAVAGTQCVSTQAGVCGPKRVPEPSSLALVSLGLVGFAYSRRRFRKS